jgi:hypothetical protein
VGQKPVGGRGQRTHQVGENDVGWAKSQWVEGGHRTYQVGKGGILETVEWVGPMQAGPKASG